MPTYEYECSCCHYRFDRRQRFDEEPLSTCPQCQGTARRVIHAVPVHFKGSGFYSTDNRHGGATSMPVEEKPPHTPEDKEKAKAVASAVHDKNDQNESPPSAGD